MKTITEIARDVIAREGGYVNDPDDPGGATKYGVTIGTMRALGLDLDQDGDVDRDDVKMLTVEKATDIFVNNYFRKPRINLLPRSLQPSVFDMQVNAGGNAVKILQRLLAEFGRPVAVDGALGPQTAGEVKKALSAAPPLPRRGNFVDAYGIARRNYYFRLADRRPKSRKYARTRSGGKGGWIKRAEEFISEQYQMTDAEFAARVKSWG
ncbi:MAG: peptidoglycan-binding protein [Alphaproteobacteria bacterium]|nr:peptidoglycan-binding protein [Alphaproteobacteria bacterium]